MWRPYPPTSTLVENRERFEECHDLLIKTWTTPGPFRWEGKHYNFRVVNPWITPIQQPHPPVWVPGSASPETAQWAGSRGYTYVAFLTPLDVTEDLFGIYRTAALESGYEPRPDNYGYLLCCYVGETQEKAEEEARHFIWRMGETTRAPREYMNPVGYRTQAGQQVAARRNSRPLISQSFEELNENLPHCLRHSRHRAGKAEVPSRPLGHGAPDNVRPRVANVPRCHHVQHRPLWQRGSTGHKGLVAA